MNFDKVPFSDEEISVFAKRVRKAQLGTLHSYKSPDKCIANALCWVGGERRTPICGNYAGKVRDTLTKIICREFTDEELQRVVSYCMDETIENTVNSAKVYCGEDVMNKLSLRIPIFMSRSRTLIDYLDD